MKVVVLPYSPRKSYILGDDYPTMKKSEIIAAIENKVKSFVLVSYSIWTIGITDDPERRRGEHGNPKHWEHWRADTEQIARDVEKHFLDKGMKGAPGGGENPNYVYVF